MKTLSILLLSIGWGFFAQAVELETCYLSDPSGSVSLKAECGTVTVPENRTTGNKTIDLKLAIIRSLSKNKASDPVLMLAGGPGQSALESYPSAQTGFQHVLRNRDVILVDQRGTGQSNPLNCDFEMGEMDVDDTQQVVQALIKCRDSLDADLAQYTTTETIKDLEAVRSELAITEWNLLGISYGTRKALTYMRMYPQSVRSVILDGVVNQQEPLGMSHDKNITKAIRKQFELCENQAACQQAFGDVEQHMWTLLDKLGESPVELKIADPMTGLVKNFTLTRDYAVLALRLFAYSPESMRLIPLLVSLAHDKQPENLALQAKMIESMLSQGLSNALELSVICTEDEPFYRALPEMEYSLFGNDFIELNKQRCDVWPHVDVEASFKQAVVSDIPTLLLSGELDPVTPPEFAEIAMQTLSQSQHIVAKGQGHNVFGRGCLPKLVSQFYNTPQEALETECLSSLDYTPFFVNLMGPQE